MNPRHLLLAVSAVLVVGSQPLSSAHAQNQYGQFEWLHHKTIDGAHPSPIEQKALFLLNQARANPAAEGDRLKGLQSNSTINNEYVQHGVRLGKMRNELSAISNMGPLAFDANLYRGQRDHNHWMIKNDIQAHGNFITNCPTRVAGFLTGYSFNGSEQACNSHFYYGQLIASKTGINIFAAGKSAEHLHAGLTVDWGKTIDTGQSYYGMQSPRGHRDNRLRRGARMVGIAIERQKSKTRVNVGKYVMSEIVTRGHTNKDRVFLVGTVWQDRNTNGTYDEGEGISGVEVAPVGVGSWYAVTGQAGGYALPLTGQMSGPITVSFTGGDLQTPLNMPIGVADVGGNENVLANFEVPGDSLLTSGDGSEDIWLSRDSTHWTPWGNNANAQNVQTPANPDVVVAQFEGLGEDYEFKVTGYDISGTDIRVSFNGNLLGYMNATSVGGTKNSKFGISREMQNPGWNNEITFEHLGSDSTWMISKLQLKSQRVATSVLDVDDSNDASQQVFGVPNDKGRFGSKYGTGRNYFVARYVTEVGSAQNVTLRAKGYDVGVNGDGSSHIAIYVNGTYIEDMLPTASGTELRTEITGVPLNLGKNTIEFRHTGVYKKDWGVTAVKLTKE